MCIRDRIEVVADQIPDGIALAAYRIVQEALTNVRKHAPGSVVQVSVMQQATQLVVLVSNGESFARASNAPAVEVPSSGHGITGMRERVRLYGGNLSTGPSLDRGWVVEASLPLWGHGE